MKTIKTIMTRGSVAAGALAMSSMAMAGVEMCNGSPCNTVTVPEPSTLYLFGLALAAVAVVRKLRK